ncbi:MAG: NADH-quinone oxidoreductase subunit N [Candidatus Korarchaeum sp.]|nr:NADH-quinone oxidoreductase subunit N [Candidatus Korarchaeum sp.]MDW8035192.1 NADH-quinone oxidoreductase subunit N [Candidatus Korarchaeum sp.]
MKEIILALILTLGSPGLLLPLIDYVKRTKLSPYVTLLATALATALVTTLIGREATLFNGALRIDPLSTYLSLIATLGSFLVVLASLPQAKDWSTSPSLYSLILLSLLGVYFILYVNDASVLIAAWALVAVASYVIVGIKKDESSLEASVKYALMGAISSSLLVFGVALVFGITRDSSLSPVSYVSPSLRVILLVGVLLLIAAFGFKMGVVPFHAWLPDVYGGAHPLLVSFVSGVIKLVSIGAFLRVLQPLIEAIGDYWLVTIAFLSILTMFYGNLAALVQRNVQRMMAYSSIAQAGYFLVAFTALYSATAKELALQAIGLQVTTYVLAKVGIFVGLGYLARKGFDLTLDGLKGVGRTMKLSCSMIAILMFSLMGMPPLIGFWSKFMYVFLSIIDLAPWLALIGIVNSGISVGYYALVIRYMYFANPPETSRESLRDPEFYVLLITGLLTIVLGLGLVDQLVKLLS